MAYEALARGIVEGVGGRENIASAINCMTRVRLTLRDDAAVRADALRALDGVLAVSHSREKYVEVVVGPGKSRRCVEALRAMGIPAFEQARPAESASVPTGERNALQRVLYTFGQIFSPLIPGIIAAGLCAGAAAMIAQLFPDYADHRALTVIYNLLSGVNGAFMTYLTAWTGYRATETFGGSPILGGMLGMFTTLGNVDAISAALGLYDQTQPLNALLRAGRGGVLAAVLGVFIMCRLEAAISKRMPDALDVVFTPLLTLLIGLIPHVFVVMPALGLLSTGICRVVGAVALSGSPAVRMAAGFLGAALFLPMVAAGMHHGLIALYTVQLETFGYVTLYPALAMAGAGQVGAALAIARKARRVGNRRLCRVINGALPAAVLGVGEPLIYGVTLPLGRPFLTAGLGAGFGGAFVMLMQVASTTWGPSGVLGAFVMTEGPLGAAASIGCYLIGLLISCAAGCLLTWFMVRDQAVIDPEAGERPIPDESMSEEARR